MTDEHERPDWCVTRGGGKRARQRQGMRRGLCYKCMLRGSEEHWALAQYGARPVYGVWRDVQSRAPRYRRSRVGSRRARCGDQTRHVLYTSVPPGCGVPSGRSVFDRPPPSTGRPGGDAQPSVCVAVTGSRFGTLCSNRHRPRRPCVGRTVADVRGRGTTYVPRDRRATSHLVGPGRAHTRERATAYPVRVAAPRHARRKQPPPRPWVGKAKGMAKGSRTRATRATRRRHGHTPGPAARGRRGRRAGPLTCIGR